MMLRGLDHADIRVRSIAAIESFYDTLLPALGLTRKTESHVDAAGEWQAVDAAHPRTAIEYHTPMEPGALGWFVGFIEDAGTVVNATRIAFAIDAEAGLPAIEALVRAAGGRRIERSDDETYPAVFFEDPLGTRLEICARRPRAKASPADPRKCFSSGSTFEREIGYSRAVRDGDYVFVAGTTGFDYSTMTISESVVEQAQQACENIAAVLERAGASFAGVVRVRYILPDVADFAPCWPVLRRYFGAAAPAATMFAAGLSDPRMKIEIEVTARVDERDP